jgi:16S rRNA (uracil1498-N3)-methyltransferase
MPRFFCAELVQRNATFALDTRVAQHVRVLRLREGEAVTLFDGSGGEVPATLEKIDKREVIVATAMHAAVERESDRNVTLYAALIANDRMDWMIQKATELGVAAIQPMYTERSQRIPGDVDKRVEHWRGVAIAACEQCGRNRIPEIHGPVVLTTVLSSLDGQSTILLDAGGGTAASSINNADSVSIFVGPEGGFAPAELELLRKRCDHKLRIGRTVLRAETAAIAALASLVSLT